MLKYNKQYKIAVGLIHPLRTVCERTFVTVGAMTSKI